MYFVNEIKLSTMLFFIRIEVEKNILFGEFLKQPHGLLSGYLHPLAFL